MSRQKSRLPDFASNGFTFREFIEFPTNFQNNFKKKLADENRRKLADEIRKKLAHESRKKLAYESRAISKRLKSHKHTIKGGKKNKKQIKKKRTIKKVIRV